MVWAQQHLRAAGLGVPVDGVFGSSTKAAVVAFQQQQGLAAGGGIGPHTWNALLQVGPAKVAWRKNRSASRAAAGSLPEPRSAKLRPRRNELRAKRAG